MPFDPFVDAGSRHLSDCPGGPGMRGFCNCGADPSPHADPPKPEDSARYAAERTESDMARMRARAEEMAENYRRPRAMDALGKLTISSEQSPSPKTRYPITINGEVKWFDTLDEALTAGLSAMLKDSAVEGLSPAAQEVLSRNPVAIGGSAVGATTAQQAREPFREIHAASAYPSIRSSSVGDLDDERLKSAADHCRGAGKLLGVDFGTGPLHEQFESVAGYLIALAMSKGSK